MGRDEFAIAMARLEAVQKGASNALLIAFLAHLCKKYPELKEEVREAIKRADKAAMDIKQDDLIHSYTGRLK